MDKRINTVKKTLPDLKETLTSITQMVDSGKFNVLHEMVVSYFVNKLVVDAVLTSEGEQIANELNCFCFKDAVAYTDLLVSVDSINRDHHLNDIEEDFFEVVNN